MLTIGLLLASPGISLSLLTDYLFHAEPASPPVLVSAGGSAYDPTFGTKIVKLTDSGDGRPARPPIRMPRRSIVTIRKWRPIAGRASRCGTSIL